MPEAELKLQLQRDAETLRLLCDGLTKLEGQWRQAQANVAARQRGYFTPDEDDWVRQMLLSYRNYRLALYEIILRYWNYREIPDVESRLRGFLLGLAAGLTLYAKSLKLIQAYEHEPLVRQKLNEPDAKFEIEAGFFDHVLRSYSSLRHYRELIRGIWFWQRHRRAIQKLAQGDDCRWLLEVVRAERSCIRRRLGNVLLCRLRYDWRALWQTTFQPVHRTRYGVQSLIGGACAGLRLSLNYRPALAPSVCARLVPSLQPGDVLLIRAEEKLTSALLPGFWAHAALYIGQMSDLDRLGLREHRYVGPHVKEVERQGAELGAVIEAISPRVLINRLDHSLVADHVVVLRPNLPRDGVAAAIGEAFGHVGKPYDFEFDFNVSSRIVCTELVYRSYHKRGPIHFSLIKRLGRFTLTADDIATLVLEHYAKTDSLDAVPFKIETLVLKGADGTAQFVPPKEAIETLRRIHGGWRPSEPVAAAPG